jgi:hypothetical protein
MHLVRRTLLIAEWVGIARDLHQRTQKTQHQPFGLVYCELSDHRSKPIEISNTELATPKIGLPAPPLMHHQHGLLRITNEKLRAAAE